ncbi:electron transfer flavoprotein subunit beta/FixA family protein [Bacillus sp. DNRA2]|uniref:electron transfer flavoprotein subunit beta/FixA family protein n=1 Tax=Bacillus sp. DNRA2 TaxID=2723053 RepID=UPI00145FA74F|nr:electron transfer flavoprotein subunit beta/FixA family protein [Bacillus sp. DNRA2]NMD71549.1 electron transfer flavoprotein subunit beta/FixA family protein [Bacillus sp. DNRA2]
MDILVCFKVVHDLDMLGESDWETGENLNIDLSYTKKALNSFDESALEIALNLSDSSEGFHAPVKLTALSITGDLIENFIKTLYALKYDKVVQIDYAGDLRFNSAGVAHIIAAYYKKHCTEQAIFMGRQSGCGDNGETPLRVAELLGIPCVTGVLNMKRTSREDILKVIRQVNNGTVTQLIKLPAVFQIGDSPITHMRVPTLKDKMNTKNMKAVALSLEDLNLDSTYIQDLSDIELISLVRIRDERKTTIIDGKDAFEKADILYHNYIKERL